MNAIVKPASLLALLATTAWAARSPSLETVAAFLTALVGYGALERSKLAPGSVPSAEERAHDLELFARYERMLGEAELTAELNTRLEDCRTTSEFLQKVEDWCRLAKSTSGQFLSTRLQSAMENYRGSLVRLGRFTAQYFFLPRDSSETTLLSLLPDQRHMHGEFRENFDRRAQELRQIVSDVEAYYKAFRVAVKEELRA